MPYPYQSEQLSPEEQAKVPYLTNIPESAEAATGRGQDVYFLSDRPETEQFLAQKSPERPYKQVLRDVRATRPPEGEMLLSEARRDFGANEGKKMLGFDPTQSPNPGEAAQAARDKYLNLATPQQMRSWDEKTKKLHYSEADKQGKSAYQDAINKAKQAHDVLSMFDKSWTDHQKQLSAAKEPSKEPLVPVQEGDKIVYRRRTQAVGAEVPPGGLVQVQDEEGNIIYQPRTQAIGKTPPPKPEKTGKKVSYVGWDKSGKETVERLDVDDTDAQGDLISKGYVEKTKFDRMDMVDRKLAQREAMKRIGGGIPLDRATAAKFLKEAGGDKEKARKLAREKGYIF